MDVKNSSTPQIERMTQDVYIYYSGSPSRVGPRQLVEEKRLGSRKRPRFGLRSAFPGQKTSV
jgi:hypothetical protein